MSPTVSPLSAPRANHRIDPTSQIDRNDRPGPFSRLLATHVFVEPPSHIYRTWAENSSLYGALAGHPNVLDIASPLLGVIAVTWTLLLAICWRHYQ